MIAALPAQVAAAWHESGRLEIAAAMLALVYVLLAVKQWRSCWIAAFVSSCLYVVVLFGARLYMESLLNAFYAGAAVYGFRQWGAQADRPAVRVHRWPLRRHVAGAIGVLAAALVNSVLLAKFTPAAAPFVDSLVTWASVFTTFLVARKVYENWHWWFVIDAVGAYLYWTRGLYATMVLFALYLPMIVAGMIEWRAEFAARAARHA